MPRAGDRMKSWLRKYSWIVWLSVTASIVIMVVLFCSGWIESHEKTYTALLSALGLVFLIATVVVMYRQAQISETQTELMRIQALREKFEALSDLQSLSRKIAVQAQDPVEQLALMDSLLEIQSKLYVLNDPRVVGAVVNTMKDAERIVTLMEDCPPARRGERDRERENLQKKLRDNIGEVCKAIFLGTLNDGDLAGWKTQSKTN